MGVLHQPARSAAENLRWRSQLPAALLAQSVERSSADCVQAANRLVGRTSSTAATVRSRRGDTFADELGADGRRVGAGRQVSNERAQALQRPPRSLHFRPEMGLDGDESVEAVMLQ